MTFRLTRRSTLLLATAIAGLTACNSILDVENPGSVPAEALSDPTLAPPLAAAAYAGMITDR